MELLVRIEGPSLGQLAFGDVERHVDPLRAAQRGSRNRHRLLGTVDDLPNSRGGDRRDHHHAHAQLVQDRSGQRHDICDTQVVEPYQRWFRVERRLGIEPGELREPTAVGGNHDGRVRVLETTRTASSAVRDLPDFDGPTTITNGYGGPAHATAA